MRYLEGESTYILSNFTTGDTVKITVYKLSDNSKVVDDVGCSEISTTGRFKYSFSQSISTKTEYIWVANNGTEEQQGKIVLGGYPDGIKDQTDYIPSNLVDVPTDSELDAAHGSGSWESAVPPTVEAIVDGIFDEDLTEHTTTNTAGKILQQIKSVVSAILGLIS